MRFPDQITEIKIVKHVFNKNYGVARDNINSEIRKMYGDTFESYVSQLNSNLRSYFKSNNMTKNQAIRYIEHIRLRATGSIESPILETLIQYQQLNINIPDIPIVYYVESYVKGEKLKLRIEVPKNWKEIDDASTSALKMFRSNQGNGNEIISIRRNDNTSGTSLTGKMLLSSLPKKSRIITSYKKLVNNENVDVLEFEEISPAIGSNQKRITTRYFIIRKNHILIVDCSIYGTKHENVHSLAQQQKSLYESILESIDFNTKKESALLTVKN